MKTKKLIAIFVLIATVATLGLCLSGCYTTTTGSNYDKEIIISTEDVQLGYNYQIITGYSSGRTLKAGSLIQKKSDPSFTDGVFTDSISMSNDMITGGGAQIANPTMGVGYDITVDYIFMGWYQEPECYRKWDFSEDRVYKTTQLYAKWVPVSAFN